MIVTPNLSSFKFFTLKKENVFRSFFWKAKVWVSFNNITDLCELDNPYTDVIALPLYITRIAIDPLRAMYQHDITQKLYAKEKRKLIGGGNIAFSAFIFALDLEPSWWYAICLNTDCSGPDRRKWMWLHLRLLDYAVYGDVRWLTNVYWLMK